MQREGKNCTNSFHGEKGNKTSKVKEINRKKYTLRINSCALGNDFSPSMSYLALLMKDISGYFSVHEHYNK